MQDTISNFSLLIAIRNARSTCNAERQLLDTLALRCDPSKRYMCYPSYARLGLDTGLSLPTLQRAARSLEAKSLIRRKVRKDQTNTWFINVPLILSQEAEVKKATEEAKANRRGNDADDCPFDDVLIAQSDAEDNVDEADADDWMTGGAR